MGTMKVEVGTKEASISAVVLRCRCGNPNSHFGIPCPSAVHEDRGVVSYYHKNPLRRLLWAARKAGK